MSSNHLLMIVHRIPYPPDKGDKIRSHHEFRFLRKKGWQIHLCTFIDDPEDLRHVGTLRAQCETASFHRLHSIPQKVSMLQALVQGKPLTVGAFSKRSAHHYIRHTLRDYPIQAILCFSSPTAEYVFQCPALRRTISTNPTNSTNSTNSPTLLMDLIDVDSDKWRQYAAQADPLRRWVYALESRRLAAYERRIAASFDATLVVTDAEAELLRRNTGAGSRVRGVPNGVDTDYFHPAWERQAKQPGNSPLTLVFCGLMDYHPNVDAVVWFSNAVLPRLRQKLEGLEFHIVGARPAKEVQGLSAIPGVRVLGRVDDVRPHVWNADISIAPIRIARGIQNKVLEAMAMAKPVVATNEAFEGLNAVPGLDLVVCSKDPESFARGVLALAEDGDQAGRMGQHARQTVLERYSWETQMEAFDALLHGTAPP